MAGSLFTQVVQVAGSYSPFALVAFHSRIHMVVRSGQVLVAYSQLFDEEGAVQWWQAFRCVQHQLGAEERAVQLRLVPRSLQHQLRAEERAVQLRLVSPS